ncbi:MAG TPA: hypothetical protein VJ906_12075 [Roseovarius sp.]|nr:hypothetical protein [Roseovarius sp.]
MKFTERDMMSLLDAGVVTRVTVAWRNQQPGDQPELFPSGWTVSVWIGDVQRGGSVKLLGSKREDVRIWKSLDTLSAWLWERGVGRFEVDQT